MCGLEEPAGAVIINPAIYIYIYNELVTSCRHARKIILSSFPSSVGTQ